jgi:GAF domain-containing protein
MQTTAPSSPEAWPLEALTLLGQVSEAVNRIDAGDAAGLEEVLGLVAGAAQRLLRGAWAAVVPFIVEKQSPNFAARITAGLEAGAFPEAFVLQALNEGKPILTYNRPPGLHLLEEPVMACYPLLAENALVGALVAAAQGQAPFSAQEKLCLANLANLAASAIHKADRLSEIRRDLARKEEELEQLRRASELIYSRPQLEETLAAILQMSLEVTSAQYGIFRLVDRSGQRLVTRAVAGERLNRPLVNVLPIASNSVMGWVARNRQPVCIADLRADPWRSVYYPLDPALDMRSELAVPLINASGQLEGVLNLESPRVGAFTEGDRHLLQSLATLAVTAIQEVRLLDALQEVAQLLLLQPSQKVLARLVSLACDLLNADTGAVWILAEGEFVLQAAAGSLRPKDRLEQAGSLAGEVLSARAARTVPGSTPWAYPDLVSAEGLIGALAVPLQAGDALQPHGVFAVFSPKEDFSHFTESEWDKKVLTCLAYYAALSVQYASHQDELRRAQEQRAVAETFAAIGDIAANVLHHLNNKVGTIPVRIQGIRDKCQPALSGDAYLNANLNEIERSANEAMEAVRANLSHLRPITLADVNVAQCIQAAVEAAKLPPGIRLQVNGLAQLPPVAAAQRSLSLVFTNLLDNAVDAMGGQGAIAISGSETGSWVEIVISDSGPGIAPELHDRIFELSYSGRGKTKGSKLGFGLWWVKTLMTRLGGSVAVESDGEHGATFRLRLPTM